MGKSLTAVSLARMFPGEIINADSLQVYRGFDIGTDKPPSDLRLSVPHHLIDILDPGIQFTAADFVREALDAAEAVHSRGGLPYIVGGTGLYIKALVEGLFPGPGRDQKIRTALEAEARTSGLDGLFRKLEAVDPVYAAKIRNRDRIRIIRALEVYQVTGRPLSDHFPMTAPPIERRRLIRIGLRLERALLYSRIEERVDRMFGRGLVEEARKHLENGVPEEAPAFRALGYRHVLEHLAGRLSLDEAIQRTKIDTRHYAKRQMTWFKKMEGVEWFSPDDRKALEDHLRNRIE